MNCRSSPSDNHIDRKIEMIYYACPRPGTGGQKGDKAPLLYCHFSQMGEEASYAPVTDCSVLRTILTDALESNSELNAAMNLGLFEDAM